MNDEKRRALDSAQPIIVLANALVTIALSGGLIVWGMTQERNDATQDARLNADGAMMQRLERDVRENRDEIRNTLVRIEGRLSEIDRKLAKAEERAGR